MVMDRPWPEPSTHCPATAAQLFHSLPENVPKERPEAISRAAHFQRKSFSAAGWRWRGAGANRQKSGVEALGPTIGVCV